MHADGLDLAGVTLQELDGGDHAVLAGGNAAVRRLVRQEVPEPEHHPFIADLVDGLHDVGVMADDQIDVLAGQRRFEPSVLRGDRLVTIFRTPVHRHDHELGARLLRDPGLLQDRLRLDQVDEVLPVRRHHEAVERIGGRDVGDRDAVRVVEHRRKILLNAGRLTGVGQADLLQHGDRVERTLRATIVTVVGGE